MVRILLLGLGLLIASQCWALNRLEASVDKNPVGAEESLVLTVIADDEVEANRLDTSSLMRQFLVGRTNISRSTRIINFSSERETRWQVLLTPRGSGELTIPAFTIDGVSSNPITVTVSESASADSDNKSLYVTTELLSPRVYVGQMALYKVKLYLSVDLQRGALSAPGLEGAQIKQLGDDKESNEIIEGRRFRTIERTYGIIPDTPGDLNIRSAVFEGDVLIPAPRNGGMFSFNESRPMRASGKTQHLSVLPKPEGWQGHWLVADLVTLSEEFPKDIKEVDVGTPISRTITLLASNTDETSLPSLALTLPAELKSYPEKPEIKSFLREGQLVVQLKLTQAIVPTETGSFEIPAIEVPWWNPRLAKREVATIPGRTIRVKGAAASSPSRSDPPDSQLTSPGWWPALAALLALGWLSTALGWAFSHRKGKTQVQPPVLQRPGLGKLREELDNACRGQDGNAMLATAMNYLSACSGHPLTLDKARKLSPALDSALGQIQHACYGPLGQIPDGQALRAAIDTFGGDDKTTLVSPLKSLNP